MLSKGFLTIPKNFVALATLKTNIKKLSKRLDYFEVIFLDEELVTFSK